MALYTRLDVVNRALGLLGQLPVNEINTPHPAVPGILLRLDEATRDVQTDKWWFNTETTTLQPQAESGFIAVPNDTASIDALDKNAPVTHRGSRLYNLSTGTFVFAAPVEVRLHRVVPFEDLPAAAARYIRAMALLGFQAAIDGDGPRYRDLAEEGKQAYAALTSENTRNQHVNLLDRHAARTAMNRIVQNSPYPNRR